MSKKISIAETTLHADETPARAAGHTALDEPVLSGLLARYRALASEGFTGNCYRQTPTANDAVRLARRFRDFEDMMPLAATSTRPTATCLNESASRSLSG
jgi:transposase